MVKPAIFLVAVIMGVYVYRNLATAFHLFLVKWAHLFFIIIWIAAAVDFLRLEFCS